MELIDLTGQKFGKLTVINRVLPNHFNGGVRWKCKCECSKKYIGYSNNLNMQVVQIQKLDTIKTKKQVQ